MSETQVYLCPCCDKAITADTTICPQCKQPVTVSSTSLAAMPLPQVSKYLKGFSKAVDTNPDNQVANGQAAMCFLRMKLYDKAMPLFEKAIDGNYDSADPYFMAAICLLRGKKPFLAQRAEIDKAVEYLNAANMIEPRAIHYLLLSFIKRDYFERKYLNIAPSADEEAATAAQLGATDTDRETLKTLLAI